MKIITEKARDTIARIKLKMEGIRKETAGQAIKKIKKGKSKIFQRKDTVYIKL
jgi:hypothetical protein